MNSSSTCGPGVTFSVRCAWSPSTPPLEADPRLQIALLDERLLDALNAVANLEEVVVIIRP